jgi:hypothetical protein
MRYQGRERMRLVVGIAYADRNEKVVARIQREMEIAIKNKYSSENMAIWRM